MSLIANIFSSFFPDLEGENPQREREFAIDASTRLSVVGLIKASIFWLILSTLLGLLASIKLHTPSYQSGLEWLTYGKVFPAFWNALVYGWLVNAGLACVVWIVARLAARVVSNSYLLNVSNAAWNLAVIVGLTGIFRGDQAPYRMLEFPVYAAPLLFAAFVGMGLWTVLAFRARAFRSSFASQWYALAAVFSFIWIYTIAQVMLFCLPAQGVFQGVVASWFGSNLFGLVIAPMAFATIYYLIPKALGQQIVGYRQSGLAFWSWIAFTSCSGLASLVNGPYPSWVASLGVVACFGLFLPVTIFSMQFLSSLFARFSRIWDTISMRFVFYAVVAMLASGLLIVFGSLRSVQETVQFSQFDSGVRFLFLAGFCGMAFIGGAHFILPRLLNKELPSAHLADLQFWIQGLGVFTITVGLIMGGFAHGGLLNGSQADTILIMRETLPSLVITTIGFSILLCGNLCYAVTFLWILYSPRSDKEKTVELIKASPEMEYTAP